MDLTRAIVDEIPYLRRFAWGLTGDRHQADDLVQDCVERALTRLHLFDRTRNLRIWLFTILRNIHINNLRKQSSRGPHVDVGNVPESLLSGEAEQFGHVVVSDISKALDRLPPQQKEVLLLISLEQVSYLEAAQILDLPIGTIMSRLSRGRNRMRELLEDQDKPGLRQIK